jgi:hypothetical protein
MLYPMSEREVEGLKNGLVGTGANNFGEGGAGVGGATATTWKWLTPADGSCHKG